MVSDLIRFLEGDTDEVVAELEARMAEAAENLEFELAARHRDRLDSVAALGHALGVGTGCGGCLDEVRALLADCAA